MKPPPSSSRDCEGQTKSTMSINRINSINSINSINRTAPGRTFKVIHVIALHPSVFPVVLFRHLRAVHAVRGSV